MGKKGEVAYQFTLDGGSKRASAWLDILMEYARELGDRPDMTLTEWYKRLVGMTYSRMPEMATAIRAIIKSRDVAFGVRLMERFFTLDAAPAPDTPARAGRDARRLLIDTGKLQIKQPTEDSLEQWGDLLTQAEAGVGKYESGIEARFGCYLKERYPEWRWEENKKIAYNGRYVCPDFVCERLALSIEIDSLEFHQDRDVFTTDRKKARFMQALGYKHLQFSGPELSIPGGMNLALDEIGQFIQQAGGTV
jgi:hypothetical protein